MTLKKSIAVKKYEKANNILLQMKICMDKHLRTKEEVEIGKKAGVRKHKRKQEEKSKT